MTPMEIRLIRKDEAVQPVFWIAPGGVCYEVFNADCYRAPDGQYFTRRQLEELYQPSVTN